jgi:uncharacterized protein
MRTTLTLAGEDVPCFELRGRRDGPRVSIVGGVHGCQYSSIAAVIRVMRSSDESELAGTVVGVPVVSLESFRARSPFVVPVDGRNLNRSFPGARDGSYTERLAADIFDQLIEPADALLDLHGGDLVEALEPFALYDAGAVEARSRELALAFGMGYVIREDGGLSGTTSAAAAAAGVPAVTAEAGGIGQLSEAAVALLADGARNALRVAGSLPGDAPPPRSRTVRRFVWLRCAHEGFWAAAVAAGEAVRAGAPLGTVSDLYGDVLEEVRAPEDGVVLFLTTSAAVGADGLLLGLGADLT